MSMMRVAFICILIAISAIRANSQDRLRIGLMPHFNVNHKIAGNWRLNFKFESRQLMRDRDAFGNENPAFRYLLSDLSLMVLRKTGLNNQVGGGYLVRIQRGKLIHRATQQFSLVRNYRTFRLAHRIVSDQTFEMNEPIQWRLRYRLGFDVALHGESVDRGEFYIKMTNEYLNVFRGGKYDFEIRLVPVIGYAVEDHSKLEVGVDARYDSFIEGNARQSYWLRLGWFFSI